MTSDALSSGKPKHQEICQYYDSQTGRKLSDFTNGNMRVEAAWATLCSALPPNCGSFLEIGCGIGAICWRMARRFPSMQVVGIDVSPVSISIARSLFARPNLTFAEHLLHPGSLNGQFDCILLMDVYEHIHPSDRAGLHASIRDLLSEKGRLVLTFPSPRKLTYQRTHEPHEIQPVDECITCREIATLSTEIERDVLCFKAVEVWNVADYYHAVLGSVTFPAPVHRTFTEKVRARLRNLGPAKAQRIRMVKRAQRAGLLTDSTPE